MKTVQGHPLKIEVDEQKLKEICERWGVATLEVFGSVLRDDFDPENSDIDLVVEFLPAIDISSFDRIRLAWEFEKLFCRNVDLLRRVGVEEDINPHRREEILSNVEMLYEAQSA